MVIPNRQDSAWDVKDMAVDFVETPIILTDGPIAGVVIAVLVAAILLMTGCYQFGYKKGVKKSITGANAAGMTPTLAPVV